MVETNYRSIKPGMTTVMTPPTWLDTGESSPSALSLIEEEDSVAIASKKIPAEYFIMSELALEEMIREKDEGKFDRTLGILKILFWDEYRRALVTRNPIITEHVWRPLVSERWWAAHIIGNPLNLAWMLSPPADEAVIKREMLLLGLKRLREAMELPLREKKKIKVVEDGEKVDAFVWETNVPLLKEIHSIVKTLQDRVHGAVTQQHNIMQRSLSVSVKGGGELLPQVADDFNLNMEQLDLYAEKLKLIESKMKDITESDGVIVGDK